MIVECKEYLGYYLKGDKVEINKEFWSVPISDNYWLIESSTCSIGTLFGKAKNAYGPDTWLSPIKTDGIDDEDNLYLPIDDLVLVGEDE